MANECMQHYLADDGLPFITEESIRRSPVVRVEFEQAIAISDIGSALSATRNKHWGQGPQILPLKPDDWFYAKFVSYQYRTNSLYNIRFEQRMRLKELLGRRWRPLVEQAKRLTKTIFLRDLTKAQASAIQRILEMEPGEFWRAARGRKLVHLPPRLIQQEFDFDARSD
ncbi:MAG: hypothetical protein HQ518_28505 [Rhodopirellula sp.]|nr:hypothetical protein [Rhodopirellula sp.]